MCTTFADHGGRGMNWLGANNKAHEHKRVRVFLDHWEFSEAWKEITGNNLALERDFESVLWDKLPQALLDHLDEMDYLAGAPKEMRAVDVYASLPCTNTEKEQKLRRWLNDTLDQVPGYTVHVGNRKPDPRNCKGCGKPINIEVEKGIKTKVACDLLSLAMKDAYDVGILVMDDPELIPSIQCVQEILDKQVIHVGMERPELPLARQHGSQVRSAAWGHILLESLVPSIHRGFGLEAMHASSARGKVTT